MKKKWTANRPGWDHGHMTNAVPGTAVQLPDVLIPDGFAIAVRALPGNTDNIYLGKSKAMAESATDRLTYSKGNGLTLKVKNANQVWLDVAVGDEGVDYWFEI